MWKSFGNIIRKTKKPMSLASIREYISAAIMQSEEITIFTKLPNPFAQNPRKFLNVVFTSIRLKKDVSATLN